MIGQTNLRRTFEINVPRFLILVGQTGSGKKTLANEIGKSFKSKYMLPNTKVDTIRDTIDLAYKVTDRTLYIIPDADIMSIASKNALLKITEEPPHDAYFILTVTNIDSVLPTLRSRASVFHMENYSVTELSEYASKYDMSEEERHIILDICETPLEIDKIHAYHADIFYSYVAKVVDNLSTVSDANALKIATSIAFKDEADKYDLKLFWKVFITICASRLRENPLHYHFGISITSKYLQELRIVGIDKASTFDMWILNMREEWG